MRRKRPKRLRRSDENPDPRNPQNNSGTRKGAPVVHHSVPRFWRGFSSVDEGGLFPNMRIRTVKPEFWSNENMARMPDFTRLLALALLNYADDYGYFWANHLLVRGALFPFEEDSGRIRQSLVQLEALGFIRLGKTADGREVGHVVKFCTHQRVNRPQKSAIQEMGAFTDQSVIDRDPLTEQSPQDRNGMEGKGVAPTPPARERNLLIDALAEAEGTPLDAITKAVGGRLGGALKEIRESTPDVTADEIRRRARLYPRQVGDKLTANALAKWWGKCGGFRADAGQAKADPYKEPQGWKDRLPSLPYDQDTLAEMAAGGWSNMPIYVWEELAR